MMLFLNGGTFLFLNTDEYIPGDLPSFLRLTFASKQMLVLTATSENPKVEFNGH